jgi:predicted restriction endonuclease
MSGEICKICRRDLNNRPIILVEGEYYCFYHAKIVVKEIERNRFEENYKNYRIQKDIYDKAYAIYLDKQSDWEKSKKEFFDKNKSGTILPLLIGGLLTLTGFIINAVIGVIAFFLSIYIANVLRDKEIEKLRNIYLSEYPEPHICISEPTKSSFEQASYFPIYAFEGDDGLKLGKDYRQWILERDKYRCQGCLELKATNELEVHHIIPRNFGGQDVAGNLITLCLDCHDREKWFGHHRIHARTIKEEKPRQRFRRHRFY